MRSTAPSTKPSPRWLDGIVSRFFVELNALLYLGVLSLVAGIGRTMTSYSERLGDAAILIRAILALFTGIITAASVGLVMNVLELRNEVAIAVATAIAALGCIRLADHFVVAFRLYRFGAGMSALAHELADRTPGRRSGGLENACRWRQSQVEHLGTGNPRRATSHSVKSQEPQDPQDPQDPQT